MSFLAAIVLSSAPIRGGAAELKAVIEGPNHVRVAGQKLILRAAEITTSAAMGYRWTIEPELRGFEQLTIQDQGRAVLVHTLPGDYIVTLTVAGPPGANGVITIDSVTHSLSVPGAAPCPPPVPRPPGPAPLPPAPPGPGPAPQPSPSPDPTPAPPAPDPWGIRKLILASLLTINDPQGTAQLRDKLTALAAKIRAGGVASVQGVIDQLAADIKANGPRWSLFATTLRGVLQQLLTNGAVDSSDLATWARLLDDLAAILKDATAPSATTR